MTASSFDHISRPTVDQKASPRIRFERALWAHPAAFAPHIAEEYCAGFSRYVIERMHGRPMPGPVFLVNHAVFMTVLVSLSFSLRDQISRALCLQLMIPDAPDGRELETAERFVCALGGPADALAQMRLAYEQSTLLLRLDAARSSFLLDGARRKLKDDGMLGLLANLGEVLGVHENAASADRYRALGALPEGSLGRALFSFYRKRGFAFPGEHGGAPESIIAHALTHVLTGYSTDLESEACVTAFQAGYRREGPFGGLLFVLLNMQKGVRMTRLAPGALHMFGEPRMAERIVSAWKNGTLVKMDLVTEWNYWPDMGHQLIDVRAALGVTAPRIDC